VSVELVAETPYRWRIERSGAMRVPGIVFAVDALLSAVTEVGSPRAGRERRDPPRHRRGVVRDARRALGLRLPIGGVAATDVAAGGVVSPGGVGFDISCGVRLLCTDLDRAAVLPSLDAFMDALARRIPRGLGPGGVWAVEHEQLEQLLREGARYAVAHGHGSGSFRRPCGVRDGSPGSGQ
jgi:tRNA-splicing ligase RtcB